MTLWLCSICTHKCGGSNNVSICPQCSNYNDAEEFSVCDNNVRSTVKQPCSPYQEVCIIENSSNRIVDGVLEENE